MLRYVRSMSLHFAGSISIQVSDRVRFMIEDGVTALCGSEWPCWVGLGSWFCMGSVWLCSLVFFDFDAKLFLDLCGFSHKCGLFDGRNRRRNGWFSRAFCLGTLRFRGIVLTSTPMGLILWVVRIAFCYFVEHRAWIAFQKNVHEM